MSCLPEWKLAVYVDGELEPEELRPLEAHLIGCQSCRARVVALRDEAELISRVLHDHPSEAAESEPRPAPARGLAMGVVPAVAAFLAATSIFTWILESGASSFEWFSPLRLRGAIQMGFDFVFMLRDRVPGLFELLVAMAALAAVSALLTYAVTALSRRWLGTTSLGIALLLGLATPDASTAHFGMHEHTNVVVAAGEVHEGTIVSIQGERVDIDGDVTGDLFVVAHQVTIRGKLHGNAFIAAQNVDVSGEITGSLHVLGTRTNITGRIGNNVYGLSENFTLAAQGSVESDLWLRMYGGVVEGKVGRDLYAEGRWIEIRGDIGRDFWVRDMRTVVMPTAKIGRDIHAELEDDAVVDLSPQARLGGELHTTVLTHARGPRFAHFAHGSFYLWFGLRLCAAFLAGMLLHFVAPWLFRGRLETSGDFFRAMGIGLVTVLAVPVALVLVFVTLFGIPLAVFGWWSYLSALYTAGLLTAALIGTSILRPASEETSAFGLPLLLGLLLAMVAMSLPFVGGPVRAVVILTGLGLLVDRLRRAWAAMPRPAAT